jgi:hypothetical protein
MVMVPVGLAGVGVGTANIVNHELVGGLLVGVLGCIACAIAVIKLRRDGA